MEEDKKICFFTYYLFWWCFFTYSSICANIVRKCLNKNKRIEAEKREMVNLKISNWENGKQGKSETLIK
ncbi:hypothetical protein T552_04209 [Pneumocystis carinii B80]|uniref:Uncharacterized protein n=1 Tax=Pneumocystis carinii (strain B80) TaxID=1408658 RepID=A0A0W4ZCC3_PNEC8|nr:hypothetical protein T552_04209 [Pneumocystis carinii B80]KTW26022.1 hypothetical protein T552_04209 [Pneumocystis carinii B80]